MSGDAPSSSTFRRLRRSLVLLGEGLLRLVYPARCLGCFGPVAGRAQEGAVLPLCAGCLLGLERADPYDVAERLARLPQARPALDAAFALWVFGKKGPLQQVQHALKYGNRPHFAVAAGRLVGEGFQKEDIALPDLVIPVPLHRARYYERGYNQSEWLGRGLSGVLGRPLRPDLLRRTRATPSQTALSRSARWTNVADAFAAPDADALEGRRVLLVDDLLTTGATAAAAGRALKAAGASAVTLAVLGLARA